MVLLKLEIIFEEKKDIVIIPSGHSKVIGRGSQADIIVNDQAVSKKHCRIFFKEGQYFIEDLGSRNFTFLNQEKIEEPSVLKNGDIIKIGRTTIKISTLKHKEKTAQLVVQTFDPIKREIILVPEVQQKQNIKRKETVQLKDNSILKDNLFLRIFFSLPNKNITPEQKEEILNLKKKYPQYSIKNILLAKNYINDKEAILIENTLNNIISKEETNEAQEKIEEEENQEEKNFIKIAIIKNFIDTKTAHKILALKEKYKSKGEKISIKEIIEKEKILTKDKIRLIEGIINKSTYKIDGYEILSLIGIGGMASIYKARQISMDRIVAIKILADEYKNNPQINKLFLEEARAVAKLNHENIIAGYDFGEINGLSYFIMEYVDGPSLQQKLKQSGDKLPLNEALDITIQVCKALEHAWSKGLIHRDIKPHNILLTSTGIVKLCDLGLAKRVNIKTTSQKNFGTPAYMSPEQIRDEKDIDIRTDIYSLGVTLYRMIFGVLPFTGTSREIMEKHLIEKLKFPSDQMDKNKIEIAKIINKMMAKKKEDRYQNPTELLNALINLKNKITRKDIEKTIEIEIVSRSKRRKFRTSRTKRSKRKKK